VDLLPQTEFVHLTIAGTVVENPSYLDVNTVSMCEKYSSAAKQYMQWAGEHEMVSNGTAAMYTDPDGDGLDNLAEYGLGGNPTNGADRGHFPAGSIVAIGSNMFISNATTRSRGVWFILPSRRGLWFPMSGLPPGLFRSEPGLWMRSLMR